LLEYLDHNSFPSHSMKTSLARFSHATRFAIALAQVVAVQGRLLSAEPPNARQLKVERHLTLAPQPGNPRNSEGDFIQLKDGRWLFVYTHFTGGGEDHSAALLASRESSDGGKTWSDDDRVVVPNEGGFNVMSVSLLRLKSGQIALFYLRKNSLQDCRPWMRLSTDEAKTWSDPVECITDQTGYYVLNNNRVIQLTSGRLVMPTALHVVENGSLQPGSIVVYLSDDAGNNWRRSSTLLERDASGTRINLMEPGVVEVATDRLLMVIRTELGCQYFSESSDQGETWSTPYPSELLSPEAPATLARIPSTGDLLVVWNDQADKPEEYRRRQPPIRTPLAAAISRDGGKTWGKRQLIETKPGHGYCYTALAFAGERVMLAYCAHASSYGLETAQISSFLVQDLVP
jgi:sialidase-1